MSSEKRIKAVQESLIYKEVLPIRKIRRDMAELRASDRHHEAWQLWCRRLLWCLGPPTLAVLILGGMPLLLKLSSDMDSLAPMGVFMVLVFGLSYGIRFFRARASPTFQPAPESTTGKVLAPVIGVVAAAGLFYFFGLSLVDIPRLPLIALLVLPLVAMAAFLWGYYHHSRLNLEDRRYELMHELLPMIGRDLARDDPLELQLDLAPADDSRKLIDTSVMLWTVRLYADPWLQLSGRLLDGTRFSLIWTDKVKTKTRVKRKGQVKKKRTSKCSIALHLKVKADKHPRLQALASNAAKAVQLPQGTQLNRIDVSPNSLSIKVTPDEDWSSCAAEQDATNMGTRGVEIIARMFLSLYQILSLARELRKRHEAG